MKRPALTLLLLAAASLVAAAACSGGGSGDAGALPGRIVFVSDESGDHEIWVMNGNGSDAHQLGDLTGDVSSPEWSGDGGKITFFLGDPAEGTAAVMLMDEDGKNVEQLTEPAINTLGTARLLADGDTLQFNQGRVVMLLDLPTKQARKAGVTGDLATRSPDGSLWAYTTFRFGARDGASSEVRLTRPGEKDWTVLSEGFDFAAGPRWSPDGSKIVMGCTRDYEFRHTPISGLIPPTVTPVAEPGGVCVVTADGTGIRKIIDEGSNPTWSPDGEWIAFERGEIYIARADGSDVHAITNCGCQVRQPDWGP
jgi:Tol biopolymer transport system component